jgi:hypothetical protein
LGQEAGDCCCVTGVLLMPERDDADTFRLCFAREVRNRDSRKAEDRIYPVQLECVDDQVEPVGHFHLRVSCHVHLRYLAFSPSVKTSVGLWISAGKGKTGAIPSLRGRCRPPECGFDLRMHIIGDECG